MPEREAMAADETRQPTETETDTEVVPGLRFLIRWNAELTAFYAYRYQQYWALPLRLLSCSTPGDVQTLQGEFVRQLIADYRDEAARLSKIAGEPEQQSGRPMEPDYAARLQKAQQDAAFIIDQAKAQAERILASAEERASQAGELPKRQTKKQA